MQAILTETLASFLPGQAKDLSAALYVLGDHLSHMTVNRTHKNTKYQYMIL